MKHKDLFRSLLLLLTIVLPSALIQAQDIPEKPNPPRLVNDFAGMLRQDEINNLEERLVVFNDSTSTQIAIVIVPSLNGYDKADYAQRLGEKWGIGKRQLNNGVLILVKPKQENSKGQVFIAQGYGLEGVLPDLTCSQIVDNDILPSFRQGNYYEGLYKAVTSIMAITRGEYTADDYGKKAVKRSSKHAPIGLILIIIVVIILISKGSGGSGRHLSSKGLPFWMLMSMMNSGSGSHGGSWGGFSGGGSGGGFGGGGGGFGGFGGGGFGGGGAGGSW
jgi:uncharacterized protein